MNNYIRRWHNEQDKTILRVNNRYYVGCDINSMDRINNSRLLQIEQSKTNNYYQTRKNHIAGAKMKKSQARKKVMQIMTIRSLNPQRLTISRTIKDESLVRDLQQVIPNSQFYYSADSDKIYTVIADKVVQIGVVADE